MILACVLSVLIKHQFYLWCMCKLNKNETRQIRCTILMSGGKGCDSQHMGNTNISTRFQLQYLCLLALLTPKKRISL